MPHLRRKRGRSQTYFYFDTGHKTSKGQVILAALPAPSDPGFARAYAACVFEREKIAKVDTTLTVSKLIKQFQTSPRFAKKAEGTQRQYNGYLKIIDHEIGNFPAEGVERVDVMALMNKKATTPGAANSLIRTLSALYSWALKEGLIARNPVVKIEMYDMEEHEPWPAALLEKALADDDLRVSVAAHLLYFTAQRIGDVARMRWPDIKDGEIRVVQEKTGLELFIPIHCDLEVRLRTLPRGLTTILAQANGRPWAAATIRGRLKKFLRDHGRGDLVPHGLRKNAVNALLEAGCSTAETSAISGQSLQMVEHYAKGRNRRRLAGSAMEKWQTKPGK